jgi:hypothetical protein
LANVVNRLLAFLFALIIILIAFAETFLLIYFDSDKCKFCKSGSTYDVEGYFNDTEVDPVEKAVNLCGFDGPLSDDAEVSDILDGFSEFNSFCKFEFSFLKVYTMLLGEVSDDDFFVTYEDGVEKENSIRQIIGVIYFTLFMFLVVVLLANVLIAIVTDSYGVIKNERAAIVFWSNRLDFIAEMDAIWSGPFADFIRGCLFLPVSNRVDTKKGDIDQDFGRSLWKTLTNDITNQADDLKCLSLDFFVYAFFRIFTMFFVIIWIPLGFLTFGYLWPPQVRAALLTTTISKSNQGEVKELEQRSIEVRALREEVKDLQDEIVLEMTADRREVVAMKTQFKNMKYDLQNEMKDIKQIVMMLFDLQASADM